MGFRLLEHTADVGVLAWGHDPAAAFEEAARGMFSVLTELDTVKETGEALLEVSASELDTLIVDTLSELLFIHETEELFLCRFDLEIDQVEEGYRLRGRAWGERMDPDKHPFLGEIKAVTYHKVEVKEVADRMGSKGDEGPAAGHWSVQVYFDL